MTINNSSTSDNTLKELSVSNNSLSMSPSTAARLAILFYLLLALLSPLGLLFPATLIDNMDAAATVSNIQENEPLFRLGIVLNLFGQVSFMLAGISFYFLFRDVDKFQAMLLMVFVLVSVPMTMAFSINHFAALHLVGDAEYLNGLNSEDLNARVVLFMNMYEFGIVIVEVFWGLWLIPLGYLFYKSGYIPRILGVLLIINGIAYVLAVVNWIMLSEEIEILNMLIGLGEIIGEIPTILWLLVMGVKLPEGRVKLWM